MALNRDVREKHHFHSCPKCGFIWDHDPPGDISRAEFRRMHSCTNCGSGKNCDIACNTREEAEEFATHEVITTNGKKYHAPSKDEDELLRLLFGDGRK